MPLIINQAGAKSKTNVFFFSEMLWLQPGPSAVFVQRVDIRTQQTLSGDLKTPFREFRVVRVLQAGTDDYLEIIGVYGFFVLA